MRYGWFGLGGGAKESYYQHGWFFEFNRALRVKKNVTHKAKRMKWKWENKLQAHKYKHA